LAKSTTIVDLESPSITTAALYALASPRVPQIVRDEAVERARAFGAKSLPGSDLPGTIDAHALYALASTGQDSDTCP
jgi:hypothetical protein